MYSNVGKVRTVSLGGLLRFPLPGSFSDAHTIVTFFFLLFAVVFVLLNFITAVSG